MFGYIAPALGGLDEAQKARYRSSYCGLCRSLRSRCGQICRATLSNDMTFLALLLDSLYEPELKTLNQPCIMHPLKKQRSEQSRFTDYAADMNLLLFWYKLQDKVQDEHSASAKVAMARLKAPMQRIRKQYPVQTAAVEDALSRLWQQEKAEKPDTDLLCNLSGAMLGAVFVPDPDDLWASLLYRVGEGLGRFVYWMDAYEDYDQDEKQHCFNPLLCYHEREDYEDFIRKSLELLLNDAVSALELLPLEKNLDLLRNVVYSGVWQRYAMLQNSKNKENTDGKQSLFRTGHQRVGHRRRDQSGLPQTGQEVSPGSEPGR